MLLGLLWPHLHLPAPGASRRWPLSLSVCIVVGIVISIIGL
ncbi:hypothetical protein MAV101_21965 [Mycobacterium avium subsp. hominissuis 101]|uniref:Uncharacterized protein n=1 Tax=Mycobacterium avium (strain 104) TaxID=243243 RepID=A0A0H2ZZV7_MYCA1|nr:hypothetical protein MAV_4363 [Mycobacterium avium 104]ETA90217.1 hypothetical protein O984_23410 [Mycobacterium avium 05-4293]ETB18661.1 hypothetical protein O983_24305 [Mycobacterium avium 09-5983]ETB36923.1 hypothetical protein N602_22830 [Mycobacterium avium subsp. hominissuis 10-5606]ETB39516.1 hypothetical protein O974_25750 [Mycobacterium avium 11-0986]ETZ49938.1 hypothetical protein L837_0698 [Mycobacterium avium MAV_061107_1842]EUA37226.1 hypothetical protein I549_1645 [Mycobacter